MSAMVKPLPVQEAYEDLLQRSLSRIPCDLGRLLYLASTRDYNTGNYHHDGLAGGPRLGENLVCNFLRRGLGDERDHLGIGIIG